MPKRIIICSDGTGNTAVKGRGTNVFKLYEAIDLNGHRTDPALTPQVALYDDGVGTEDVKLLKIFAGMTGFGLGRNVRQLYKELARVYDPGDEIYVFGFSRGAFTVRTLVGLIAKCGVLDPTKLSTRTAAGLHTAVKQAYRFYRQCFRTRLAEMVLGPATDRTTEFRRERSHHAEVRIRFVGVWDTVDAVGLPFHLADVLNSTVHRFKFPDYRLSPSVDRACHALALDDERHSFSPLLWDESGETEGRVSQVWFAGAHSNVGGGYPKQGLSLVALDWMLTEAERAGAPFGEPGLRVNQNERQLYREHANVDDKLYDPRAGLGVFYRWRIRDMRALCLAKGVAPRLHLSVLERIAHGTEDYAPGNLAPDATVVFTETDRAEDRALVTYRAENVHAVLAAVRSLHEKLLPAMQGSRRLGLMSYYVYLIASTAVLLAAAGGTSVATLLNPLKVLTSVGRVVGGLLSDPAGQAVAIVRTLGQDWSLAGWLLVGFLLAYVLSLVADRRMSAWFSGFWYDLQPKLRDALKQARLDRLEAGGLGG